MSVSKYRYTESCDGQPCPGDCDLCGKEDDMDDLISRQAAFDVTDSETVSTNPEHFKSSEKFIKFMNDADIASFGKWQWANGFNTALVATKIQLEKLPSAQSDISGYSDKLWKAAHERGKREGRKTGKWIHKGCACFECNQCGERVTLNVYTTEKANERFKFCPNCGADMRGIGMAERRTDE